MIRREPTLIAMSDADVQDVRSLIARRKNDAALKALNGKGKGKSVAATLPPAHVAAEEARRKREATSKDERLGLQR
ncbi:hypothetical protein BV25DRAFT_1824188 [Artomyces pyxidatus]|uniref:Uncharacterized protein n=1 Tax=Artomyces pyxidatus TaxID=48021 RepID=A0ACB8T572_9AGAM|nr:hypothetical protein BV25DRAFT_1824188 [Artomyces pyxidatus]